MGYSAVASQLRTKCTQLSNEVRDAEAISFDSVWSGEAHDGLTSDLKDLYSRTEKEISNIEIFASAFDSLQ